MPEGNQWTSKQPKTPKYSTGRDKNNHPKSNYSSRRKYLFHQSSNLYEFLTRAKSFENFNDDNRFNKYRKFDAGDSDEQKDDDKWNYLFPTEGMG